MNKSDSIEKLAAALVLAHAELSGVAKTATNPFFKSKYADLASVVESVKGPLLKQGIVVVQGVQDAEEGVAVETMLLHSSGQWISSTLRLPASKQDAQGYGSATTYGRRYGLMAICGVPAEDDDGNAATASAPIPKAHSPGDGELALLPKAEQETARKIANAIIDLFTEDKQFAAYEAFYESNLTNEIKLGVWEILRPHTKIRSALKKMNEGKKAA